MSIRFKKYMGILTTIVGLPFLLYLAEKQYDKFTSPSPAVPKSDTSIHQSNKIDSGSHNNQQNQSGNGNIQQNIPGSNNKTNINSPSKKITGPTIINGGNNNFGTNSGQIGNNYYSNEPSLNKSDIATLIPYLENLQKQEGIKTRKVNLNIQTTSNGQRILYQIDSILVHNGYEIIGGGQIFTQGNKSIERTDIHIYDSVINIDVGYFPDK